MSASEPASPTRATIVKLAVMSGNRCAFPHCDLELVQGNTMVGEFCHIRGASAGGPRYDAAQTALERHSLDNLILLCANHHRIVDTQVEDYPAERLLKMKADHEGTAARVSDENAERAATMMISIAQTAINAGAIGTVNIFNGQPVRSPRPLPISAGMAFAGLGDILSHMGPLARDVYSFNTRRFAYLRLVPPSSSQAPTNPEVVKTVNDLRLLPMSKQWSGTQARNKHGAMYYVERENRSIAALTQLFTTGEIWGMTSEVFEDRDIPTADSAEPHRLCVIPALPMEQTYVVVLENYMQVAQKILQLPLPYEIELGITGIEHGFLLFPSQGPGFSAGPIYAEGFRRRYTLTEATFPAARQLLARYFDDLYADLVGKHRRDLIRPIFIGPNDLPPLL